MLALLLVAALAGASESEYRQALPGYRYAFPRDYFEHPAYRTEWWYYTGNLRTAAGRRYGFEMVFFRQAQRRGQAENRSAWRIDDLYLAHLALSDIGRGRFRFEKRLNRAGPGIAGASLDSKRIWNGNWSAEWEGERQTLQAIGGDFRFRLELAPLKPVVIHGIDGVSQKASGAGKASHYISFTRLGVRGVLSVEEESHEVTGSAWMDHEWFTHQLEPDQVGWDWFSIQLDNQTELMLFQLRRNDGSIEPFSSGTFVDSAGRARHLKLAEFELRPLEYWTSPKSKARYPIKWRIRVPSLKVDLECAAALRDQELPAEGGGPGYWEGTVTYTGSHSGVGYLEMTGYDKPVRF
jgi:predicted secreted hydrolase